MSYTKKLFQDIYKQFFRKRSKEESNSAHKELKNPSVVIVFKKYFFLNVHCLPVIWPFTPDVLYEKVVVGLT